jgi:putative nucleotidyltransferase with HDIG domain
MNWNKGIARFWNTIRIVLIYFVGILLVYFMFPREGKFRYEYAKNKPWMHENLVAPFDFPIFKTDEQLQREMDSLESHQYLYFIRDTLVGNNRVASFTRDFNSIASSLGMEEHMPERWVMNRQLVAGILKEIYTRGIIERQPVLDEKPPEQTQLMVLTNDLAEEYRLSAFYTLRSAYEYLTGKLVGAGPSALSILNRMNLNDYLEPNIIYDEAMTIKVHQAALNELTLTQGMVQSGQLIIARGELVTQSDFLIIESLRKEYESNPNVGKNYLVVYLGQFLLITLIFMSLYWFIYNYRKDIRFDWRKVLFTIGLMVIMVGLTRAAANHDAVSVYVIPFVLVPIFLKTFFDIRYALFVHMVTLLLAGFWVPNSYQFVLMNFLAGLVGVLSLRSYYKRGILFYTALFVLASYTVIYVILTLLQEGDFGQINWINVLWLGGNSLLILTVYPLIFLFERVFGFLSDATLFELTDTNQPLLRILAETAPGTFQHSMQVASLAEEAVMKVGGNSLLIRAGALYHDIGKMENPQYFIENLHEGSNPHNELDERTSARLIIDHVVKGVEIAKKHKLNEKIIEFIQTHHGTGTVQYFYRTYLNTNPDEEVDINEFRYPGPKPSSKEQAILMMADSVEAASRTLKQYTRESISELVENIIRHQTAEEQFTEADVTFGNITQIKEIFKNRLTNIYHSRIAYPE